MNYTARLDWARTGAKVRCLPSAARSQGPEARQSPLGPFEGARPWSYRPEGRPGSVTIRTTIY